MQQSIRLQRYSNPRATRAVSIFAVHERCEKTERWEHTRLPRVSKYIRTYVRIYVASRIDVYARRSAGPASRAEPSRRRDARRRAARRRAGRITGTQQSLAGLRAGMRWSRDACRDTQRLRPLTRSLAIIRRDISFPRVPLPRIDACFPSEYAHRVHRRTIAHFRIHLKRM